MILSLNQFNSKLPDLSAQFNHLDKLHNALSKDFGLDLNYGAELEFYLSTLINQTEMARFIGYKIQKEQGKHQYEIQTNVFNTPSDLANEIFQAKSRILNFAKNQQISVDFSDIPNISDFGSALHFHIAIEETSFKIFNVELLANILCKYCKPYIDFFVKPSGYSRLRPKFNAPTHICYGGNNRTCLIRIPDSRPRRLEHRLAGSSISPILPLYAIIAAIYHGLEQKDFQLDYQKIHGNAYDLQYNLEPILG